jgi:Domain of unknown function (DUF4267)
MTSFPIIVAMGVARGLLGVASIVAPSPCARLLGFPPGSDTPTARVFARLFGVRNIGLGVLVAYAVLHKELLGFMLLFNAAIDIVDLGAIAVPIVRRQGINRAAWSMIGFALSAALAWVVAYLSMS